MTERDYSMKSTYKGFITVHMDEARGMPRHIGYRDGKVIIQTHSRAVLYRYLNSLVPQDYETTVQDRILDKKYVEVIHYPKKEIKSEAKNNEDTTK